MSTKPMRCVQTDSGAVFVDVENGWSNATAIADDYVLSDAVCEAYEKAARNAYLDNQDGTEIIRAGLTAALAAIKAEAMQ